MPVQLRLECCLPSGMCILALSSSLAGAITTIHFLCISVWASLRSLSNRRDICCAQAELVAQLMDLTFRNGDILVGGCIAPILILETSSNISTYLSLQNCAGHAIRVSHGEAETAARSESHNHGLL